MEHCHVTCPLLPAGEGRDCSLLCTSAGVFLREGRGQPGFGTPLSTHGVWGATVLLVGVGTTLEGLGLLLAIVMTKTTHLFPNTWHRHNGRAAARAQSKLVGAGAVAQQADPPPCGVGIPYGHPGCSTCRLVPCLWLGIAAKDGFNIWGPGPTQET